MKFKKRILIVCLLILFASIMCVSAGNNDNVPINSDEPQQALDSSQDYALGETANGTFTELQRMINNAGYGSTITLDKDYVYDEGFNVRGIEIDNDITIDGNGHTLNGLSQSRILLNKFSLFKNQVTLKNIKFTNGNTDLYGGAIFNYGNMTLINCEFTNNYAKYAGGAIASIGHLSCNGSKFTGNTANGDGGAIFCLSIKSVIDIEKLLNGRTLDGNMDFLTDLTSATSIKFAKETISNCIFTNNVANGRGGGAVYAFGNIDIKSCTFNSNNAGEKGGAVFGNKDLFITNSRFTNNQASKYGGAVYFRCHQSSGHYENGTWVSEVVYFTNLIQNSIFTQNSASKGGAIYGFKSSTTDSHGAKAVKCTFTSNTAPTGRDIYGGTASNCIFNYWKMILKTISVKKSAKGIVLAAKLAKGKTLIKNKIIAFKFNGKVYKAKTDNKGLAKVIVKNGMFKNLKVGKTVIYQAQFGKLIVKKAAKVTK